MKNTAVLYDPYLGQTSNNWEDIEVAHTGRVGVNVTPIAQLPYSNT